MQPIPQAPIGSAQVDKDTVSMPNEPKTASKALTPAQVLDAWDQTLARAHHLLEHQSIDSTWITRFTELTTSVRMLTARDPDTALYVLIEANGRNVDHYSSQHAVTCLVIVELVATWMQLPEEEKWPLALAALSMNLSITALQNTLARQSSSLSDLQREMIASHASASADMLLQAGVANGTWLYIVRNHHVAASTAPQESEPGQRLAELLRRVDIYSAKLSRRGTRHSVTPAIAAKDSYLNTQGKPDSIGAALLRVVGLYPPGTFVELTNGETAVVISRGTKAHTPIVASVRQKDGGLLMQPLRRNTLRSTFAVKHGIEPSQVRILLNHRRNLACI